MHRIIATIVMLAPAVADAHPGHGHASHGDTFLAVVVAVGVALTVASVAAVRRTVRS